MLGALVLSFAGLESPTGGLERAAVIVAGLAVLLWLARSQVVDRALRRVIEPLLRRFTDLDVRDYAALLHLRGQWRVAQVPVGEDDWIAAHPLGELRLPEEGVAVLAWSAPRGCGSALRVTTCTWRSATWCSCTAASRSWRTSPPGPTGTRATRPASASEPGTPPARSANR